MRKSKRFLKDWENLSRSGKHDLNVLKEAMMLLIANDAPLPAEWKDHQLKGEDDYIRECHIKGDLLLTYYIEEHSDEGLITFLRVSTHSDLFKN
ncbi:MAG: type II toxin-antitoxin system YafQ family toxin [Synergistaceae bacterium]|nr:type II toxin-antitoxin system YafQ family toxin [Synergistaceae bacterium]MBR0035061.1 type II toxin-antitoxin system YafQ family toxin [Synergistaceae bacterium]